MSALRTACIIPTYNAGKRFRDVLEALGRQVAACDVLVVDSSSTDGTPDLARAFGVRVDSIPVSAFSHGGTRRMMVERHPYDAYVFLTQDAVPDDENAVGRLLAPFDDARIGAVGGRQIGHRGASPLAEHARRFNYAASSRTLGLEEARRLGIRAAFLSNSFAAYRRVALDDVGGFPRHVIMGEDMFVAARMLLKGWRVAYEASAVCRHSHDYTPWEECRRYFDIGVFHAREGWIRESLGGVGGQGLRYVRSELRYLGFRGARWWPASTLRSALKLVGYELGKREAILPRWLKVKLSAHSRYWAVSARS